jgi:tetratricopeptide (TPR) repeat protein
VFSVFVYRKNRGALERFLAYAKPGTTYDSTVRAVIDYHVDLGMWSELRTVLAGIKPCAAVSFFLGQANASLGDHAAAEAAFRAAIEADPAQPWPYIQLGYLFSRLGDLPRALAAANLAIEHAPREEEAHQALIKILVAHKQLAEARKAAAAMPDGPLADTLRATVTDDTTAALAAADRAIARAPTFLPALVARAQLLERKGDTAAAIEAWRTAQRIAPVDASIALRIEALLRTQAKDLPK